MNEVSGLQFAEVSILLMIEANGTELVVTIPARKIWQLNFVEELILEIFLKKSFIVILHVS